MLLVEWQWQRLLGFLLWLSYLLIQQRVIRDTAMLYKLQYCCTYNGTLSESQISLFVWLSDLSFCFSNMVSWACSQPKPRLLDKIQFSIRKIVHPTFFSHHDHPEATFEDLLEEYKALAAIIKCRSEPCDILEVE